MYREELVIPYVVGKTVLDCGGVDHSYFKEKQERGNWLHAIIAERAKRCLGVDILADHVSAINRQGGCEFVVGDIETLTFEKEFDVVVAGEVIEHIYNAGLFLDGAWRALNDRGVLIITTPNCHRLTSLVYAVVAGKEVCHKEHTCYYSTQTLCYLVERHGFAVEQCELVDRQARSLVTERMRAAARRIRPGLGETIVLVARKQLRQDKYGGKW